MRASPRCLAREILFYPTAIGWHPHEKEHFGHAQAEAWRIMQRSHAIANGVFVASPNRVGFEDEAGTNGLEFFGQSFISDPFGRFLAQADTEPAMLVAQCDLSLIEETRRNWPFLRDRRVDAYGPITQRWLAGTHVTLRNGDTVPGERPALQVRMPAEWEHHDATWIGWPHHEPDWPGKFDTIPWVYAEIVRALALTNASRFSVTTSRCATTRCGALTLHDVNPARYRLHMQPTDRVWLRDSGADRRTSQ